MFQHFDCSVFSFRMALLFDPSDRYVIFNFGSALYQINSRIRRFKDKVNLFKYHHFTCLMHTSNIFFKCSYFLQLCLDDIRHRYADRRIRGLLEESRCQFTSCIHRLPDGDVDKWRCHYFLAKIAEKRGDVLETVRWLYLPFKCVCVFFFFLTSYHRNSHGGLGMSIIIHSTESI